MVIVRDWEIVHLNWYYELFVNGKSYCTADTYGEAYEELEALTSREGR